VQAHAERQSACVLCVVCGCAGMQAHMTKIVERYQQMVDRMRKELPRFHDETCAELGGAFRACATHQVKSKAARLGSAVA
jgi:nicotinate-nucleotide pyrophosphorylase